MKEGINQQDHNIEALILVLIPTYILVAQVNGTYSP